uniref:Uncharacterized protein n=1 Tax=Tetranychus urticae TaxID=32264 RepID=T1K0N1_TETUR
MDAQKEIPKKIWRKNQRERKKERDKNVQASLTAKGEADPYVAKDMARKARKEKNRAAKKFKKSLEMFKQNSSVEGYKAEETCLGRIAAESLRNEAIKDFQVAQETLAVAETLQGKKTNEPGSSHSDLLKHIYQ